MNIIATYISGVRVYNIDDLFHTGRIDHIYKLNNNIVIIANCNNSKLQLGGFFCDIFFLLS